MPDHPTAADAPNVHAGQSPITRRSVLAGGVAASAGLLAAAGWQEPAAAATTTDRDGAKRVQLTVLGTTDLHGNVFNWDYYKNAEFDDSAHNDVGLAKVSSLVTAMRYRRGRATTLLIDAGDTIQGTPLAYYYARIAPISGSQIHPMAAAMNTIGYDAAALGNHEFNYGIPLLRTFAAQLRFPLLGANAVDWTTGAPAFPPYTLKRILVPGAPPVTVGILGLTNPGIAIWDKANVEGKMKFPGLVEQASVWVPKLRAAGADVVVVAAHSGADTSSSYGDALPYPENAATLLAEQVAGIDAILVGHAHVEIPMRYVTNKSTGLPVLLTEPLKWGERLSVIDLDLVAERGKWTVAGALSQVLNSNSVPEDPAITRILAADHQRVVTYVNSVIGTSTTAMSCATARYRDTAALDFINHVQADAVKQALVGTAQAALPVLSIAAPFNRDAAIPAGSVSVRDVAGLYIFDNTLLAITMSGAAVKTYLERSAEYFKAVTGTGPVTPDQLTNAVTPTAPNGTPDYNYDVMAGLDARLTYDIDLARPVGQRIVNLAYGGAPIDIGQQFVIAINNYRQSGGGNFPGTTTAPVFYNRQVEIRQLIIDWVMARKTIDPALFASEDWRLVANGQPLIING
jgi:2',3'-cyclic-nucleotide 2'-phosphodiesterase/3'-nucleotidase